MKILLDECVDRRLVRDLPGHEVDTTGQMGWSSNRNGELPAFLVAVRLGDLVGVGG